MYYFPDPPYFLLIAGLLISLASGSAFQANLKHLVGEWAKARSTRTLSLLKGPQILLPFVGIALGICLFLGAGLNTFGIPNKPAYVVSIGMTVFIGVLIWSQLNRVLTVLEKGGSKALDLDTLEFRKDQF